MNLWTPVVLHISFRKVNLKINFILFYHIVYHIIDNKFNFSKFKTIYFCRSRKFYIKKTGLHKKAKSGFQFMCIQFGSKQFFPHATLLSVIEWEMSQSSKIQTHSVNLFFCILYSSRFHIQSDKHICPKWLFPGGREYW